MRSRRFQRANPTPAQGSGLKRPEIVRALGRAEVVLLSSHYERYIYALNEESVIFLEAQKVPAKNLPLQLRLLHSKGVVDALAEMQWDNRADHLKNFAAVESRLWLDEEPVRDLDHQRLMEWMKAPTDKAITRFFRMWGDPDIFGSITRLPTRRANMQLRLRELVDKRNNIAHGDQTVEARYLDVAQYRSAVRTFCARADRRMAVLVRNVAATGSIPW